MNHLHDIMERRDLLWNLTVRELKIRYRNSALGFLWTLLIPLFMGLIYMFFLRLMAGRGVPMSEIIIGVFAWQFTVTSVNSGLHSITGNTNLVKKVYMPRIILPLAATLANLINYLLSLIVQFPLVAFLLYLQGEFISPMAVALPLVLILHFILNYGIALLLAAGNVHFRDLEHLIGVILSAWFFISPVMYNLSFIERVAADHPILLDLYMMNPMAIICTAYRAIILPHVSFPWTGLIWISIAGCGLLYVLADRIFSRQQKNFADML